MFLVRYVSLAALVAWLGSLAIVLAGAATGEWIGHVPAMGYACGATMLVGLVIMKFVGPPPAAFPLRAGLVSAMLVATAVAGTRRPEVGAASSTAVGLVLLGWYARE